MKKNQKCPKHRENSQMESNEIQIKSGITKSNEKLIERNNGKQFSYSAIFKILVSFYQLQSLLQVPVEDKDQWSLTSHVSNFFSILTLWLKESINTVHLKARVQSAEMF